MIEPLLNSERAELTQASKSAAVVLSTRLRLARNIAEKPFPGRATSAQRSDILSDFRRTMAGLRKMKDCTALEVGQLSDLEKQVLVERHLVSRELCESKAGAGVLISRDQSCSVMVNEEDHLRIQCLKTGFHLKSVWKSIDALDSAIEETVDFAFSPEFGYLTACPTNLGTGLRASVMMHLPGLVVAGQMEKVVRAVNQLGIIVRGLFGEGSDATGHIFQISNQQTLGEAETAILDRLNNVLKTVIEHETNARFKLLEDSRDKLLDRIGRAVGALCNAHIISSNEAMNHLSLVRLAVDFGMLPEPFRTEVDRLFIECQPGHVQFAAGKDVDPDVRDIARAKLLREEFSALPALSFDKIPNSE